MKKTHAFTLIELLVVISIIAILAGIAMPVFTSALERGRATEDKNNLSGLGKGIQMFLNDNDDSMFLVTSTGANTWPNLLRAKYVKDWKAFRSPFDKVTQTRPKSEGVTDTGDGSAKVPVSYGLNANVLNTGAQSPTNPGFVGKWANSPTTVILAAPAVDTSVAGSKIAFQADAFATSNVKITTPSGSNLGTHQKRQVINVLFADSHVEQLEWTKYIDKSTTAGMQRWDPMYSP
jgi:prepilin-type N-terminal cleavage/methylation domain-containing protein/prepilin-type processing-associated H-X9-DG protein